MRGRKKNKKKEGKGHGSKEGRREGTQKAWWEVQNLDGYKVGGKGKKRKKKER